MPGTHLEAPLFIKEISESAVCLVVHNADGCAH